MRSVSIAVAHQLGLLVLFTVSACSPDAGERTSSKIQPAELGWELASRSLFAQAIPYFEKALEHNVVQDRAWLEFGRAVCLLNRQPRSGASIEEALGEFMRLSQSDVSGLRSAAVFFVWRINDFYLETSNDHSDQRYANVIIDAGDVSFYNQFGKLKYATKHLMLFSNGSDDTTKELLESSAAITDNSLARNFERIVGEFLVLTEGLPDEGWVRFANAERLGFDQIRLKRDVLLIVARQAERAGEHDIAQAYYARFAKEYPRDVRTKWATDQVARLQGMLQ